MHQSRAQTHRAWIFTSATLGDEPGLGWFRAQAGLEDAQVLSVGSPFDYANHARLWVPTHLPAPGEPGHNEAVAQMGRAVRPGWVGAPLCWPPPCAHCPSLVNKYGRCSSRAA